VLAAPGAASSPATAARTTAASFIFLILHHSSRLDGNTAIPGGLRLDWGLA
jgi:hypothetical protein